MTYNGDMSIEHPHLTPETEAAVEAQQGGPLPLAGERSQYVVMRMGVGSDEAFAASVAAIREGMEDVRAGRTRPAREFLEELGRAHET
jgi:hypothetical protein